MLHCEGLWAAAVGKSGVGSVVAVFGSAGELAIVRCGGGAGQVGRRLPTV